MFKSILLVLAGILGSYVLFPSDALSKRYGTHLDILKYSSSVCRIGDERRPFGTCFSVKGIDGRSYVLTNAHVCEGSMDMIALFQDKEVAKLTVVKQDKELDLCLLYGEFPNKPLDISSDIQDFEPLTVLGSPHAGPMTVSLGNFTDRYSDMDGVGLTSVKVYPGNSGSPVFNNKGYVVGIINSYDVRSQNGYLIYGSDILNFLQRDK